MDTAYKVELFGEDGWEEICETYTESCAMRVAQTIFGLGVDARVTIIHKNLVPFSIALDEYSVKADRNV